MFNRPARQRNLQKSELSPNLNLIQERFAARLSIRRGGCGMSDFLPREVRAGLEEARRRDLRKRSRLRVMVGGEVYPILRFWDDGFALDADQVAQLRGLVDIYDGSRHLWQSLIIASEVEAGELICLMKRSTAASDRAPIDYVRDEGAPVGYLPRH